jgi:hypothetical protein
VVPWVILLFLKLNSGKKVHKNFEKLLDKYSLEPGNKANSLKNLNSVRGLYRGRDIKIESMLNDPVSGNKGMHTVLLVNCSNPDNFSFSLLKRNRQNNSSYGKNSVPAEDSEFDSKFVIVSNDPARIKNIFDFNTRFKLDQVHKLGFNGVIELRGNSLMYSEKGKIKDDETLMRFELVLHEFCDIADVMKYN